MIHTYLLLFFVPLISGALVYTIPKWEGEKFKMSLIFSGSYLFAITVIHVLPELFHHQESRTLVGSMILAGFFLQVFLEYFSTGVEHGHVHAHKEDDNHTMTTSVSMLVALCFHSFLEGTLLAHPSTIHAHHQSNTLLFGILLHKIPAAFALMSVVTCHFESKKKCIIFLIIFALASPLGLLLSDYLAHEQLISETGIMILFAVVGGSFLKISTTIFFESSDEHRFGLRKIIVSVIAAAIAIIAESLF